jgi:excisionase family DNA binding protein
MPIQIGEKTFYTVEDICEKTGMHKRTVQRLLKAGALIGKKQGKRWYVSEQNLQAYFDADSQSNTPDLEKKPEP